MTSDDARQPAPALTDSSKTAVVLNQLLPPPIPVATDPDDLVGVVLAERYKLVRILGSGGMGTVYLGEHVAIGKPIAVKVLALRWAQHAENKDRFLIEARAATKVGHENVVEILDVGDTPNGSVFMAMELLRGEPLSELLAREGPIPWPRAKGIVLQICRALHAAHEKKVLHRDVKPENCFRLKRGANRDFIKVIDFGIAKIVGDEGDPTSSLTRAGAIFGTPEYMSPEQARGKPVGGRSDVYSTGILLYEMVTGQVPFTGPTLMDVLSRQVMDAPTPPRTMAPHAGIPFALEAAILRAILKDPAERFQTMRELAEALAAIPTVLEPATKPGASADDTRERARELRVPYVGVIATLCIAVVVLSIALAIAVLRP